MIDGLTVVNLSSIDANLLVVLHAVLEERSVSRAAKRLHVTPPAVSNSLARLRTLIRDPLLVRSGRGLVATPRALELQPTLARAIADLSSVLDATPPDPRTTTRQLTIAMTDAHQISALPAIAARFGREMPRARLRVVSVDTLVSHGDLAGGAADLALGPIGDGPGLCWRLLYEEEGVLLLRRGHPDAKRFTREAFERLGHVDPHIALGRPGVGHRIANDALAELRLVRRVAVEVPTFAAAAMVVAETDLATGVPRRMAERLAAAVAVEIVEMPFAPMRFPIRLVWHERVASDPIVSAFRELVARALDPTPPARSPRRQPKVGRAQSRSRTAGPTPRSGTMDRPIGR